MVMERQAVTYEQFEAFLAQPENADRHWELIDGVIVEKEMTTELYGVVAVEMIFALRRWLTTHPIGRLATEVLYRSPADPSNARQPDISFTLHRDEPIVTQGAVARMPDLAIEIKSPGDTYKVMREKAYYYLEHGSRLVWLVYPEKRQIEVLTADDFDLLGEHDTLNGGELLPGFALPVKEVFAGA